MKHGEWTGWLSVVAVCIVLTMAVPPFAAAVDHQGGAKDLCLLNGENCPDRKETITELIERLKPWGEAMRAAGGYIGGPVDLWPNRG